jgi:hypothetical protein
MSNYRNTPSKIIYITPKKIARVLLALVGFFCFFHIIVYILRVRSGTLGSNGFQHAFDLDHEFNFPALYSAAAILVCSFILWKIGKLPLEKINGQSIYWRILAGVFFFLALDEFFSYHEGLVTLTRELLHMDRKTAGYFYMAWFIPYLLLFGTLGVFFIKFYLRLPGQSRLWFTLAGIIYVSGAVGMEMIGGKYIEEQKAILGVTEVIDLKYTLMVLVEEALEMVGIIIFLYALSIHYSKQMAQNNFILQCQISLEPQTAPSEVKQEKISAYAK